MSLTSYQRYQLKKFLKEIKDHRGRGTELVSVYIPAGYDLNKIINHLQQEQGTATNIKSSQTRNNVISALERMIQHLRIYKGTPKNGLAAFSGNVATKQGVQDVQVWSIEPPVPLKIRIYRCDKSFIIEPLDDMMDIKEVFGLVVMDRRDATLALLKGKSIIPLLKTHSEVPGKMKAGGQCCVKDTLIQNADGSIIPIEQSDIDLEVKSLDEVHKTLQKSTIIDKWETQKDSVYKIVTKNPRFVVEVSGDHLLLVSTPNGIVEKPAEDLKKDDILIFPEKIDVEGSVQTLNPKKYYNRFDISEEGRELLKQKREEKGLYQRQFASNIGLTQTTVSFYELGKNRIDPGHLQTICEELEIPFEAFLEQHAMPFMVRPVQLPSQLDPKLAQFLGYYLGDGSSEVDRITLFEQQKEVAIWYRTAYKRYFGMNVSYRFREDKNYHQLRFSSRPLVRFIQNEFPELKKTKDSLIPMKVLQSPNEVIAAFLRGFFDAEGYVHTNHGVALGIHNRLLARQLQMVLLRFSILSSFLEYDNKGNPYSDETRYSIAITEKQSLELFRDVIGFTSKSKTQALMAVIKSKSIRNYSRQVLVWGSQVRQLVEKAGFNLEIFPKVTNFFRNERMMSKQVFKKSILSEISDEKLWKQLLPWYHCEILPVIISSIEKTEKQTAMIDISVDAKSFVANGLIVHNSAARFAQNRMLATKAHFKKVADHMKNQFLPFGNNLKGIIVGGPGHTKYELTEGNFITGDIKKKIISVKDITYTDEFGLQELLDASQDVLAREELATEKKFMTRFLGFLARKPGMVAYGEVEVKKILEQGAVDTVLLSEDLDDDIIEQIEETAEQFGTKVLIVSTDTREGVQLRDIGKYGAILRYEMHHG